jgi:transcriptional regulator with XRE-family HTH domain
VPGFGNGVLVSFGSNSLIILDMRLVLSPDPTSGEIAGWPRWAAAVSDALARRGLSVNAAAEYLGVRNTTLKRWLDGVAAPQLSLLPKIAELSGLTHAIQLELGGVLPATMSAEAHAIQVTNELRSVVGAITQVVARAGELAFSDVGARLAGILLSEEGSDLQVTLRRVYRGHRYPVHLSTYVGVQRLHGDTYDDAGALRRRVTQIVGESARALGAQWREQDPHDWLPPRPDLILNVPQHERPRPASATALSAAPNILMLGCPYAHAEYIGAVIADALGYGYLDVRYSVSTPLDLDPTDPAVTTARTKFIRELAANGNATYKHVWSIADHRVLPAVADNLISTDIACVIYVRSGDRLLARGGEIWNVPMQEMLQLRTALDSLVEAAPWSALTLSLPDELLLTEDSPDCEIDRDRVADVAMLAAVDCWRHMNTYGFVPRATAAGGRLRTMFDSGGRPSGDPRPSMITEARRMPARHARR